MLLKQIGRGLGYFVFLVAATLFFMYVTFPMERVRVFAEHQLESATGMQVSIEELSVSGLSGVELFGTELTAGTAQKGDKPLRVDYLGVETSLLEASSGGIPATELEADLLGGQIRGLSGESDGSGVSIDLGSIQGIEIDSRLGLSAFLPNQMDVEGVLDAEGQLNWQGSIGASSGNTALLMKATKLLNPRFEQQGAMFNLTDVALGDVEARLRLAKKEELPSLRSLPAPKGATLLHFESVSVSGDDVEVIVDEKSAIVFKPNQPVSRGRLSVKLAFFLTDDFFKKETIVDGVKETPNSFLKTIMNSSPQFSRAKKNGYYGLTCKGTLGNPDCKLQRPTMRIVGRAKPRQGEEDAKSPGVQGEDKKDSGRGVKSPRTPKPPRENTIRESVKRKKRSSDGPQVEESEEPRTPGKLSREERLERVKAARERAKAARDARRKKRQAEEDEALEPIDPAEDDDEEEEDEEEDDEEDEEEEDDEEEDEEGDEEDEEEEDE